MAEQQRPMNSIGGGLQHERTLLAWERTAVAMMVGGLALARYASISGHVLFGVAGILQTAGGGALLFWAGINHDELHSPATPASAVPQVALARLVGIGTVVFTVTAAVLVLLLALDR